MCKAILIVAMALTLSPVAVQAQQLIDATFDIVPTNSSWQGTGLQIQPGDRVYLFGFAAMYWNGGHQLENIGAEAWQEGNPSAQPAPGLGYGIVYRIGESGASGVPQLRSFGAGENSGELQFAYNDIYHGDNSGSLICGILIARGLAVSEGPLHNVSARLHLAGKPNPATQQVDISYELPKAGRAKLLVHDRKGAVIATLVDQTRAAGKYSFCWNGLAQDGRPVPAGTYFYTLEVNGKAMTKEVIIVK